MEEEIEQEGEKRGRCEGRGDEKIKGLKRDRRGKDVEGVE